MDQVVKEIFSNFISEDSQQRMDVIKLSAKKTIRLIGRNLFICLLAQEIHIE